MKRIRMISFIIVFSMLLSLTACSGQIGFWKGDSYIYALNAERSGLVKVSCDIPKKNAEEAAQFVLKELKADPAEIDYTAAIPKKVKVQECELKGSILEVDFSSDYLDIENLEEKLVRAAVVQSLLQISAIQGVLFTVDGEALKARDGYTIGLMNEDDFVENTGSSPSSYQTDTLTLYFANSTGDRLVSQKIDVKYSSNISKEKLIVEKLLQGPKSSGAYPTINPDANLLSVATKDGICYVNFDSTFLTNTYDVLPEVTIYSLVNSLVRGTDASEVQITVNGESNAEYMGTVDLSQPLQENMDLVAVEGK